MMTDTAEYNHLLASILDLDEASSMIDAHLRFANEPANLEAYGQLEEGLAAKIEQSLLVAGIIAYVRPFVQSRGGKAKLSKRHLSSLTREEYRIHSYLVEARNKILAHSDSEHITVQRRQVDAVTIRMVAASAIVVIPGEDDSTDLAKSTGRSMGLVDATLDGIEQGVREMGPQKPKSVTVTTGRLIDIEVESCVAVIGMAKKIQESVTAEIERLEAVFDPRLA